jgi:hypothetical protein
MTCDLPDRLNWARLRVHPSGTADVLDCDGRLTTFPDEESARHWLAEDEFDRLEDLIEWGDVPRETRPPEGGTDAALLGRMLEPRPLPDEPATAPRSAAPPGC